MDTDQAKNIGKIQEQIQMEDKSRRLYPRKWSKFYQETPWQDMYNQNEINKKLEIVAKVNHPFIYANEGDSYFTSPEMYKALVAVCRCGRPRNHLHLLKCLQNQQNTYSLAKTKNEKFNKLPETSSGFVGWQNQPARYKQWENSMKYVSPLHDMPGERITAASYNTIIIG